MVIHIIGKNKAGKSLLANELIGFEVIKSKRNNKVEINAIFPISSNAMTSSPTLHMTQNHIGEGKFSV